MGIFRVKGRPLPSFPCIFPLSADLLKRSAEPQNGAQTPDLVLYPASLRTLSS